MTIWGEIVFPMPGSGRIAVRHETGWLTITADGVSLGPHGEVVIDDPTRPLDETAKLFWNAVAQVRGQAVPFPNTSRARGCG
jgi:hypothetical protein